jgi:hypothetical protein
MLDDDALASGTGERLDENTTGEQVAKMLQLEGKPN